MSAQKVIEIALAEVGYLEKATNSRLYDKTANAGRNNWTKYGAWYGLNGPDAPWCDMFVSWCADQAGEAEAVGKYASVWYHQQRFKQLGRWHPRGSYTPQAGDLIFFGAGDHIGFVERVSGGRVYTIEGNTSAWPGRTTASDTPKSAATVTPLTAPEQRKNTPPAGIRTAGDGGTLTATAASMLTAGRRSMGNGIASTRRAI